MTEYERKLLGNVFRKKFTSSSSKSNSKTNKQNEESEESSKEKKGGQTNADV